MLQENQFTVRGFAVWTVCALFFLYEFLLRTVIGTFQHPIMYDLHLTAVQFSFLSTTIFLLLYGAMQLPAGIILDHIGLKKSLAIGASVCTFSSLGLAYSYNFPLAILFRMLMGLGASFGFISLLVSVNDWMPHRHSALFIGLSQFIGTLGPMLAAGPLHELSTTANINWRFIFLYLGLAGAVLFLLIILIVENNKQQSGRYIVLKRPEKIKTSLMRLFVRFQPWAIALFSTCVYFTIEYLSENEGRAFLVVKGFDLNFASYMMTVSWIGYAIGCPLLGFLSDYFQRRKNMMVLSSFFNLVSITGIIFSTNRFALIGAFFLLGLGASGQSIGFATIAEQFKRQFTSVAFGLNNGMITSIAAINAPILGWALDYAKKLHYSALFQYYIAFSILIIIALLSCIFSIFFIKETFNKSYVDFTYLKTKMRY